MDLTNLIESRRRNKTAEFPISEKELCDRYEKVTVISDFSHEYPAAA